MQLFWERELAWTPDRWIFETLIFERVFFRPSESRL